MRHLPKYRFKIQSDFLSDNLISFQPNGIVEPVSVSDNDKLNFATQRQSEIYQSIKSARERITKEAEREAEKERAVWEEQGSCRDF
jgi:hypothetical protein